MAVNVNSMRVENYTDVDSNRYLPDLSKVYTLWRNTKTQDEYIIVGFILNSKTGVWEYRYRRVDHKGKDIENFIDYTREPNDWHGLRDSGVARFVPIAYSGGPVIE